jgi:hypothetical protein
MLIARPLNSLLDFNETWISYRDIRKLNKHFSFKLFCSEGQTERWTDIMNWISQFRYATKTHRTSTLGLRNFWSSYTLQNRYHITVCQVNTATLAVHWLTQMLWDWKDPNRNITLNIKYSVHKINPDIHWMCELHVTVNVHRAACSLSEVDSHFFPNISSCSLLPKNR